MTNTYIYIWYPTKLIFWSQKSQQSSFQRLDSTTSTSQPTISFNNNQFKAKEMHNQFGLQANRESNNTTSISWFLSPQSKTQTTHTYTDYNIPPILVTNQEKIETISSVKPKGNRDSKQDFLATNPSCFITLLELNLSAKIMLKDQAHGERKRSLQTHP